MEPQRDMRGRETLDQARPPDGIDAQIVAGGKLINIVERPAPVGPWDVEAHEDLLAPVAAKPRPRPLTPAGTPKLTKSERRRLKLTQVALAMRAQGESVNDIAAALGVVPGTITGWLTQHRREVSTEQLDDLLDRIAVPLATENLIHGLIAGDKDYTLETLKGRGQLKRHSEGDGKPPTTLPELRIVFESHASGTPHPGAAALDPVLHRGQIMGQVSVPKTITGSVVSSAPVSHDSEPRPSSETPSPDGRGEVPAE